MPNDCWNNIIFISEDNSEELTELFNKEIKTKNLPEEYLKIDYKGNNGIKFKLWSAWRADNEWLKRLIQKYPNCWIKNDWYEEGGGAGIFIGGFLNGKKQETIIKEWVELSIERISQYLGD
jgi:hypothetical protein